MIAKAPENYKGDFSAYSDLVQTGKNKIGVLYESDNYKKILFATVNIK
jgi:sialidase-1